MDCLVHLPFYNMTHVVSMPPKLPTIVSSLDREKKIYTK